MTAFLLYEEASDAANGAEISDIAEKVMAVLRNPHDQHLAKDTVTEVHRQ